MSSETDLDALTADQRSTLEQYTAVTAQELKDAIPILTRAEWNLQIAITRFFDGEPANDPLAEAMAAQAAAAAAAAPVDTRRAETLMNGFSATDSRTAQQQRQNGLEMAPRVVPQPEDQTNRTFQPPLVLRLLFTPFTLLHALLARSFTLLGWLFPFLPRLLNRLTGPTGLQNTRSSSSSSRPTGTSTTGRRPLKPRDTAARFIRELEEEYGSNPLPLLETGYAQALDAAKRDLKFLLVLLISPEHDDTPSYIRDTLLSPEVVSYLVTESSDSNNLTIWAGSIRDAEAYQISSALNVTKFPFAALIVHTPSVSSTAMSIVSRLVGPMTPGVFVGKLRQGVDTHAPGLVAARRARDEQRFTASIREEQNSAYERSLATDRERTRRKREEQERKVREEEETKRRQALEEDAALKRERWRRWRAGRITPEPSPDVKDAARISLRMPDGERVLRRFAATAEMEELYAFVECYDLLRTEDLTDTAEAAPGDFKHEYNFRLVSPMPREVYELSEGATIRQRIGRSGNLIVERVEGAESDNEEDE